MRAQSRITAKALLFLREHPAERATTEKLTHELAISPAHIRESVSAEMGEPLGELDQRWRLEWAGDLLANGRKSVNETAVEVGYSTSRALARAFRRYFLCNPKEFAKCNESLCPTFPSVDYRSNDGKEWSGERIVVTRLPGGHCVTFVNCDLRLHERQTPGFEYRYDDPPELCVAPLQPSEARPPFTYHYSPFTPPIP